MQQTKLKKKTTTKHNHTDFDSIIVEATRAMPRHKRIFSSLIHTDTISKISDILGSTLFRPNALLFGAISSFVLTLGTYLLSKNLGYSLSGSESIVAFLAGWTVGIIFDACMSLLKKR